MLCGPPGCVIYKGWARAVIWPEFTEAMGVGSGYLPRCGTAQAGRTRESARAGGRIGQLPGVRLGAARPPADTLLGRGATWVNGCIDFGASRRR